jgi:hypothetical protein
MSNTIWAMRLLQQLQQSPQPALLPLNTAPPEYDERPRGGRRSRRSPSPDRRRSKSKKGDLKKKERRRARSPSTSSSEGEAYGSPSESDYSSYDEAEVIKQRFAKEPCEYISPTGLKDKKSKKEVVNYLEEKSCPKIDTHAKKRKHVPPPTTAAAAPSSLPPPPDNATPAAPVPPPASVVKDNIAAPKVRGRPRKPVDLNAKPKRPPSAYNLEVAKYRKEGLTMAEASRKAKEAITKSKAE